MLFRSQQEISPDAELKRIFPAQAIRRRVNLGRCFRSGTAWIRWIPATPRTTPAWTSRRPPLSRIPPRGGCCPEGVPGCGKAEGPAKAGKRPPLPVRRDSAHRIGDPENYIGKCCRVWNGLGCRPNSSRRQGDFARRTGGWLIPLQAEETRRWNVSMEFWRQQ